LFASNHNWLASNQNGLASNYNWLASNHNRLASNHNWLAGNHNGLAAIYNYSAGNHVLFANNTFCSVAALCTGQKRLQCRLMMMVGGKAYRQAGSMQAG
jgi:hypothetical protein